MDLVYLPGYPRSAMMGNRLDEFDADFPPKEIYLGGLLFGAPWVVFVHLILSAIAVASMDSCSFCSKLLGPYLAMAVVIEFIIGYRVAPCVRDLCLRMKLYGASDAETEAAPIPIFHMLKMRDMPHVLYEEFVQAWDEHTNYSVFLSTLKDFVASILLFPYLLLVGGGCIVLYSLIFPSWKNQLLTNYASAASASKGSVVCRQDNNQKIVVRYRVEGQEYKKRFTVPLRPSDQCALLPTASKPIGINDKPRLLLLSTSRPESAVLQVEVERRKEEAARLRRNVWSGLYLMLGQGSFISYIAGIALQKPFFTVAAFYAAFQLILGFLGVCVYYRFFFLPDQLHGGKQVDLPHLEMTNIGDPDGSYDSNDPEHTRIAVINEEKPLRTRGTAFSDSEGDDSCVNRYMQGMFPRWEEHFGRHHSSTIEYDTPP